MEKQSAGDLRQKPPAWSEPPHAAIRNSAGHPPRFERKISELQVDDAFYYSAKPFPLCGKAPHLQAQEIPA
jgi:hypothetical protein